MTEPLVCRCCKSKAIVKCGLYKNTQYYLCKYCLRKFKPDDHVFNMHFPSATVSRVLELWYDGVSITSIPGILKIEGHDFPAVSVIYKWVEKYSHKAEIAFRYLKPDVSDTWMVGSSFLKIGGQRVWIHNAIDKSTLFSLATILTENRLKTPGLNLVEEASKIAGKTPRAVEAHMPIYYLDGVDQTFGCFSRHIRRSGINSENCGLIAQFFHAMDTRKKQLTRFRSLHPAKLFLAGWTYQYNFFKPQEYLDHKTPAEASNIKYSVRSWDQLIKVYGEPG